MNGTLGQIRLILCFASQGKILHPQPVFFSIHKVHMAGNLLLLCRLAQSLLSLRFLLYSDFGTTMFHVCHCKVGCISREYDCIQGRMLNFNLIWPYILISSLKWVSGITISLSFIQHFELFRRLQ